MPLRRSHQKSRLGCLPCKKRHIKCGEEVPICRNCNNRRVQCIYKSSHAQIEYVSNGSSPDIRSQAPTPGPSAACFCGHVCPNASPTNVTRTEELHLYAHYISSASCTMSNGSNDLRIWQNVIPEEAVQHEFLVDGLLSLSSLHFAEQNPASRLHYTEIAMIYQNSALNGYKKTLNNISSKNRGAIFAFSVLLNVLVIAFPNVCPTSADSSHEESVVLLIELLQGLQIILQTPNVFQEELAKYEPFVSRYRRATEPLKPGGHVANALSSLRARADCHADNIERHTAYLSGIESLEVAFRSIQNDPEYLGHILGWPVTVRAKLLVLFKQRDPMAILIFIHYGVLLLHARHRWWAKNTGICLIESLAQYVTSNHPDWTGTTQWARTQAGMAVQQDGD
ncbi:hypothetical protein FB567DRAFT_626303 [Paraphoma chrysanthemicola]|uniref:Zn(2)-C6 fungal-type domain-containing protein n=1 Tax=Paraphoma chrysanthemicola TaxID=798071 RepID=A0A8K0R9V2_9PLEO|nr:hypothetical protein FB567DRAFT_626303 [Paraphoma chrysanthemicola]